MNEHFEFAPLLWVTLVAVLAPVLARRVHRWLPLPLVVGEILAGMIIGRSGFDLIEETRVVRFLAEFGFIFLMFLSGLEMDFNMLLRPSGRAASGPRWRRPAWMAGINFVLTLAVSIGLGFGLWALGMTGNGILMGLILCTTSVGIVVPVLKERNLAPSMFGQVVLAAALLSDFVTLLLLGIVIAYFSRGLSADLFLFIVLLLAFVLASRVTNVLGRFSVLKRWVSELANATGQIRVRLAFAFMVGWVVLASTLGLEVILGAFMAGAIVRQTQKDGESIFVRKLEAIGFGFFVPFFFVMVGVRFEMAALLESSRAIWLVPALLFAAYLAKVLPALLFKSLFTWRESIAAGFLMSSRLSLIIAASAIAMEMDLIDSAVNSAIILVAVITCTASPLLFSRILPPREEIKRRGVILMGTDALAELLGKRLARNGEPVVHTGLDTDRLKRLEERGGQIIEGRPNEEILRQAGAASARAVVALSNDPAAVSEVCRIARDAFDVPLVIARADDPEHVRELQGRGIKVVQPSMAMALALEGALHFPKAFSMLINKDDEFDLIDAPLTNADLFNKPLRQLHLPANALVMGIRRDGQAEVIVPNGDTALRQGDVLILSGDASTVRKVRHWLSG